MSEEPTILATDVSKKFRDADHQLAVLSGVSLCVNRGEIVALLGPSGSGKSSLLHILGGLDPDYEGEVTVAGERLRDLSDTQRAGFRSKSVGFVFQSFNLLRHLSARENVLLAARFTPAAADVGRARELLADVGLEGKEHRLPSELSGGEQQRVAIARALYHRPRVILCDEPTGNLDVETSAGVLEIFEGLRGGDSAMLMVTHDPALSARADRVLTLRGGSLA